MNGGARVTLDGTVSDGDDTTHTYAWASSGGGTFANASALDTTWTAPAATSTAQSITLTLTATDGAGSSDTATVSASVRANQAPDVSVAPESATVGGGARLTLDGTATDPEGTRMTYAWTSNGGGAFANASAIDTAWTAPAATSSVQNVVLTLTVTDAGGESATATVDVTVPERTNTAPTVSATTSVSRVNGGGTVRLDGTANDPQGDRMTFEWTSSGGGTFADDAVLDTTWTAPPAGTSDQNVTLTLRATDIDNLFATATVSVAVRANQAPSVSASGRPTTVSGGGSVALGGSATDPESDGLTYSWSSSGGGSFADAAALDTTWTAPTKTNDLQNIVLTLTVTDDGAGARSGTATVDVTVRANAPPTASASASPATVDGNGAVRLDGTARDSDDTALTYRWTSDGGGVFEDETALDTTWTAQRASFDPERVVLTLTVTDSIGASAAATASVTVRPNQPPSVAVSPAVAAVAGEEDLTVSGTVVDPEGDGLTYVWSSNGGGTFADPFAAETTWTAPPETGAAQSITLTLTATDDGAGTLRGIATIAVTVGGSQPPPIVIGIGGGGGGGPSGPTPSDVDFEWTVDGDIEALDEAHDSASGAWAVGSTLLLLQNGDGADDAVYAYDLATGERTEGREFELHATNRAPRGLWSDGETVWVSDSGQERLFAYDLETGERAEEREIMLARGNRDARGIWSDGETIWVLNRNPTLFAYDLDTGVLLGEFELAEANGDPHGVWSDGTTIWISNHDPKRLFAYRLPAAPAGPATEPRPLTRVQDEEFEELGRVGNNSPRGIWSDGAVMYVADENDDRVYSYNMPDAIDARLASLTLGGVEIGEFDPARTDYTGVALDDSAQTTVEAEAAHSGASVVIDPPDADEAADGHQVALAGVEQITVTVTSEDESRERVYRVHLGDPERELPSGCLRGDVVEGFSLLLYEGGTLEDLVVCAVSRYVVAIYVIENGIYIPYIIGAPYFVNAPFDELYPDGIPALTPLVTRSDGPPTAGPAVGALTEAEVAVVRASGCLRGEVAEGLSLVVYGGGNVDDLEECAASLGIAAIYALVDGEYTPYILGAPAFVNQPFRELFPHGLPAATPLVARSDTPR